ncbi:endonuclease/exonuclease/phosphatase family protein [Aurantivibrio plasticivorans]
MAKAFSVLSWNVEHFGATAKGARKPRKPVKPIIDLIAKQKADVIAIYEVVGKEVFQSVSQALPNYQFHITEGPQTQEILIGVKQGLSAFFTQKTEFKSGNSSLRPGALLTITKDGASYPLLFLHLKSLTTPRGFGLRDDMIQRSLDFKKTLDKALAEIDSSDNPANFIAMGDLNTMGMNLSYSKKDISGIEEIERLDQRMKPKSISMRRLSKSADATWWPGSNSSYSPSNLDHVLAASHLKFKNFSGAEVDVRGWTEAATDTDKDKWAEKFSDHALLYFEVQKV